MAALFTPRASVMFRVGLVSAIAFVTALITAPMIYIRLPYAANVNDPVEQPVMFDHRHHNRDDGIGCVYCHDTVETQAFAGIPTTERCMGCHGQIWMDSPKLAPVRASWMSGEPIPWRRVTDVPAHVYFHHGVHIQGGVECSSCHGAVENMPAVARAYRMTMNFCLDCHRQRTGTRKINRLTTCSACHR